LLDLEVESCFRERTELEEVLARCGYRERREIVCLEEGEPIFLGEGRGGCDGVLGVGSCLIINKYEERSSRLVAI